MIPKKIHFLFGLSEDFGGFPFCLYHYLAVLSARVVNKDYEIIMHYYHEPQNEWWEKTKAIAKMVKLESSPTHIRGIPIKQCAHKADLVRIEILMKEGGIYLDIDTICIRPFDPFLSIPKGFIMGLETGSGNMGLCNAVIMSEPRHQFLDIWLRAFADFDPDDWNKMACRRPLRIAVNHPKLIHVEGNETFFRLNWTRPEIDMLFGNLIDMPKSYSQHLWEHTSFDPYLSKLTLADIDSKGTTYNLLARKVLCDAYSQSIL